MLASSAKVLGEVEIRQLFERETSTYTYLLVDGGEALLIDPVMETRERDLKLVRELGLTLRYVVETHIHADHVTSAHFLCQETGASLCAGARGSDKRSVTLTEGALLSLGDADLRVLETPGHTDDSVSLYSEGEAAVFTGDALLIRGCGRTDFQNGDAGVLFDSVTGKLFTLPAVTRVYPAHNYAGLPYSSIGEEQRLNPRFSGQSREAFIALMHKLQLPPPARIEMSVPANVRAGRIESTDWQI